MGHRSVARSAESRHRRARAAAAVLGAVALLGAVYLWRADQFAFLFGDDAERAGSAVLTVTSQPTGAAIKVDGKDRDRTPATLLVAPGPHTVVLQSPELVPATRRVVVAPEGAELRLNLWAREPRVTHVRGPYPGANILTAVFLQDGRLSLAVALPDGDREAWLLDSASGILQRVGPTGLRAALAVAPDASQVAYLSGSTTIARADAPAVSLPGNSPMSSPGQVWVATADRDSAPRRLFALGRGSEELMDLVWSPEGSHLLVAMRRRLPVSTEQTRLLWLPTDGSAPTEVVSFPGQVVPGSYAWQSEAGAVAFLVRAGSGPQTAVCVVDLSTSAFRYLGDLATRDASSPLALVAPVAWEQDGTPLYVVAAPPVAATSDGPLFGLRPMGGPRQGLGLFRARSAAGTDDERLPGGDGTTSPAVREDDSPIGLARPKNDGPVVLRGIDPRGTQAEDLAQIPLPPSQGGSGVAGIWDVEHAQLLVAVPSGGVAANAAADYWLVRFGVRADSGDHR
jgi:PEGA domain